MSVTYLVLESPKGTPVPPDGRLPIPLDWVRTTRISPDGSVFTDDGQWPAPATPPEPQTIVNYVELIGLMGESVFARLEKEAKARGNSNNQDEIALTFLEKAKFEPTDVTQIDRELNHFESEGYITAADVTRIKAGIEP